MFCAFPPGLTECSRCLPAPMRDFFGKYVSDSSRLLLISKLTTVGRGIAITGFAFVVGRISDTAIEAINKIGSAFYGLILAIFLMGVLFRKVNIAGILLGAAGVAFDIWLRVRQPWKKYKPRANSHPGFCFAPVL